MRKLIISLLAVALLVVMPLAALSQAEWDVIKVAEKLKLDNFNAYKVEKAKAVAARDAGDYEKACELYLVVAEMDHCNRGDTGWIKAWQLNSAALCLIKANEKNGYSTDPKVLERILELLGQAREAGPNGACLKKIQANESWANLRLPK